MILFGEFSMGFRGFRFWVFFPPVLGFRVSLQGSLEGSNRDYCMILFGGFLSGVL